MYLIYSMINYLSLSDLIDGDLFMIINEYTKHLLYFLTTSSGRFRIVVHDILERNTDETM
jgi:hypothetical protein